MNVLLGLFERKGKIGCGKSEHLRNKDLFYRLLMRFEIINFDRTPNDSDIFRNWLLINIANDRIFL